MLAAVVIPLVGSSHQLGSGNEEVVSTTVLPGRSSKLRVVCHAAAEHRVLSLLVLVKTAGDSMPAGAMDAAAVVG